MAETIHLSDILSEINPLVIETLNYELQIRGIQPARAPSVKRAQLARELLSEKQGRGTTLWPYLSITEDLRQCASLLVRFESDLNSASRTTLTIESAVINLAFLKFRVERFTPTSQIEDQHIRMLTANIDSSFEKAKELYEASQNIMTAQEEIIDLCGEPDSIPSTPEQIDIQPLFASLNLNGAIDPRTSRSFPTTTTNNNFQGRNDINFSNQPRFNPNLLNFPPTDAFQNANNYNFFNASQFNRNASDPMQQNAFQSSHGIQNTNQSRFNQNVPLSSTNANSNQFSAQQQNLNPNFAYENN